MVRVGWWVSEMKSMDYRVKSLWIECGHVRCSSRFPPPVPLWFLGWLAPAGLPEPRKRGAWKVLDSGKRMVSRPPPGPSGRCGGGSGRRAMPGAWAARFRPVSLRKRKWGQRHLLYKLLAVELRTVAPIRAWDRAASGWNPRLFPMLFRRFFLRASSKLYV